MKRPSELKRMSDKALSKYRLDLEDEMMAMVGQLRMAKREQRARRQKKKVRKACGRTARMETLRPHATLQ